jgi:putative acetyltransferase
MNLKIVIRNETDADVSAISDVTVAAFKTLEISNHTEQFIIAALRAANALAVSLVAEMDGRVIGHIAFSPVTISDGTQNWYGLGPVSVLPEYQRQGIGKALIREGLSRLKDMNAQGCCLVGHPDYYRKFWFKNVRDLCMRECHRRSSLLCLSTGILRRAPSLFTTDSRRMANKRVQATLYSAPDPRRWAGVPIRLSHQREHNDRESQIDANPRAGNPADCALC